MKPLCNQCPVGAKCNGNIKALPNYWGYRNKDDVVMIRCPNGYCCQDDQSCRSFDSCNSNRSGPLCGVCEKGFAESLFDQTCFPMEQCHTWFIVLLYLSCVVGYGLGLMVINDIKRPITYLVKNIYQCINEKLLNNVKPTQTCKSKNSEKSKSSKKEIREESFKYLQILLFYVQDAVLFKIELPEKHLPTNTTQQTSTFIKILQFTPDVLTGIYDSLTETCFSLGSTAVSKVLFKSLFGPSVMLFLFIIYLCQLYVFSVNKKKSRFSSLIKYKLVQSFVLVILFSYQQIVTGAFTLVKCIAIGNSDMLYIQGNIQCFSRWQSVIEIFIWMSILPSFFVLSHVTYYVEMKQISVQMFILICILPVPGLMIFHLPKAWNKLKRRCYNQSHSDIDLNKMVNKERVSNLNQRKVEQEDISSMVSGIGSKLSLNNSSVNPNPETPGLTDIMSESDIDIASDYSADALPHFKTELEQATLAEINQDKIKVLPETKAESRNSIYIEFNYEEEIMTDSDKKSKHSSQLDSKDEDFLDSREAITETLLKHYRRMKLFGISFNWLAIHKIYRMNLVACNTYISNSIMKLCTMISFLLGIMLLHSVLKPYKQRLANITAAFSYVANCGIAMIKLIKAVMSEYGCQINCSNKSNVLRYLDTCEETLLVYVPIASVCVWLLSKCVTKIWKKFTESVMALVLF